MPERAAFHEAKNVPKAFSTYSIPGAQLWKLASEAAELSKTLQIDRIGSRKAFVYSVLITLDALYGWDQTAQEQEKEDDIYLMLAGLATGEWR